jgi:HPt (histidine-containing phosphotransfer) domain-containing protein
MKAIDSPAGLRVINFVNRLGGDRSLADELVEIFLAEGPLHLTMIRDGIARNEPAAVRAGAHTLKGSLGYFDAAPAILLADRLEAIGRSKQLDGAASISGDLEALVLPILDELQRSNLVPHSPL